MVLYVVGSRSKLTFVLVLLKFYFLPVDGTSISWSYGSQDKWESRCIGSRQSPINIIERNVIPDNNVRMKLFNYQIPEEGATITNNGRTLVVTLNPESPKRIVQLEVGSEEKGVKRTSKTFVLVQMHFHWGSGANDGSEHAVNGTRYALELHLVHINVAYENMREALKYSDGILVLAVIYEREGASVKTRIPITISFLFPTNKDFYIYSGSLTTPPCSQVVTWVIFSNRPKLKFLVQNAFKKLNGKFDIIGQIVRKIQKRRGRDVFLGMGRNFMFDKQ